MQPLVVTLTIDAGAQARLDAERERWFPTGRTLVGAHVTLFHAVPGERREQVEADLADTAGPPFGVGVAAVMPLGRGVAYRLVGDELERRHRVLQRLWWPHLTRQDQQGFRPHVTVQNKVSPAEARATFGVLHRAFRPYEVRAEGFTLWRYDDGPWSELLHVPFA